MKPTPLPDHSRIQKPKRLFLLRLGAPQTLLLLASSQGTIVLALDLLGLWSFGFYSRLLALVTVMVAGIILPFTVN